MTFSLKIKSLTLATALWMGTASGQNITFPLVWKSKSDNKTNFLTTCASDGGEVVATTKKEICVLNGVDGKITWSGDLEKIAGMTDSDYQRYMEDAGVIFVFNKKRGADQMTCIDTKTGKALWTSEKYEGVTGNNLIYLPELSAFGIYLKEGMDMLDARTGKLKWSVTRFSGAIAKSMYFTDTKELLLLNYRPVSLKSLFAGFKNQLMLINAETGEVKWTTEYRGVVESKIVTKDPVVSWQLAQGKDKILVELDGLQVFDLKTGTSVWSEDLNMSLDKGHLLFNSEVQVYNAIADPLIVGNEVYIVEFSPKGKQKVLKKFDVNTGKLIWTNEEIDGRKTIIPELVYVNGMVVAQIGGYVNRQSIEHNNGVVTSRSKWEWEGPFGLKAFDVESGKMIWESEKFKGLVTNLVADDNSLYVASEEFFYKLNSKTGVPAFEIKHKAAKVGEPRQLLSFDKKIAVLSQDGVCTYNTSDGTTAYIAPIDDLKEEFYLYGGHYFLKSKTNLIGFDFNTGKTTGTFEFEKGDLKWKLTKDGKFLYLFTKGDGDIAKYKTN